MPLLLAFCISFGHVKYVVAFCGECVPVGAMSSGAGEPQQQQHQFPMILPE